MPAASSTNYSICLRCDVTAHAACRYVVNEVAEYSLCMMVVRCREDRPEL